MGVLQLVPQPQARGALVRQPQPVLAAAVLDDYVYGVAGMNLGHAIGVQELAQAYYAFRFLADVDDDVLAVNLKDGPLEDFAFYCLVLLFKRFEELFKIFHEVAKIRTMADRLIAGPLPPTALSN
jgi:hypothetical protein